jgi:hypothetical protein
LAGMKVKTTLVEKCDSICGSLLHAYFQWHGLISLWKIWYYNIPYPFSESKAEEYKTCNLTLWTTTFRLSFHMHICVVNVFSIKNILLLIWNNFVLWIFMGYWWKH